MKPLLLLALGATLAAGPAINLLAADTATRWTSARANAWQRDHGWLAGCNFAPSTAINQLEMWQADTFDLATIDRELGWAEQLGFNSARVFLHDLLWEQDAQGLLRRMDEFLAVADKHHIGIMFVLFDGVWDPQPKAGLQRAPRPHVHNSGWVQSPGAKILKDPARYDSLQPYVQGVLRRFKDDRRIHAWDLFNEPDNMNIPDYRKLEPANKPDLAMALLEKTFAWARAVDPAQPLTAAIWLDYEGFAANPPIYQCMLANSDIITFHNYAPLDDVKKEVEALKARFDRPVLCTEFMARSVKSTFDPILGYLKSQQVGAYCWGLVDGKTQTIYPWESWEKAYIGEPFLWHHDIFRRDGTPYNAKEFAYIRRVTGKDK